ncbi:MAG: hypothetical protein AAF549_07470 [Pseudomonadota bacterium]
MKALWDKVAGRARRLKANFDARRGGGAPTEDAPAELPENFYEDGIKTGNELNTFVGGLLVQQGVVSDEVEKVAGEIQALARAVVTKYHNGTAQEKTALTKSGLITKTRDGQKAFATGKLFAIADEAKDSKTLEEKIKAMRDALAAEVKKAKLSGNELITEDDIKAAQKTVDDRQNLPRDYPDAPAIVPIYKALDPDIGKFATDIIPLHAVIRSGVARIAAGTPDKEAAEKVQKFNMLRIDDRDPDEIKEIVSAARRVNAYELDPENNKLDPKDFEILSNGVSTALENFKKNGKSLADKGLADASSLIATVEEYLKFTRKVSDIQNGVNPERDSSLNYDDKEKITAPVIGDEFLDNLIDHAEKEKKKKGSLSAEAQKYLDGFGGKENLDFWKTLREFREAFKLGFNLEKLSVNFELGLKNGNLKFLVENLEIVDAQKGQATFKSKNDGHQFIVTPTQIKHVDPDGVLSHQEAIEWISIVMQNPRAMQKGIGLTGAPENVAKLKAAYDELAKSYGQKNMPKLLNGSKGYPKFDAEAVTAETTSMNEHLKEFRTDDGKVDFEKYSAARKPDGEDGDDPSSKADGSLNMGGGKAKPKAPGGADGS